MREKSKHQFIFVIVIFGIYNFNGLNIPRFRKEKLFIRILNGKIRTARASSDILAQCVASTRETCGPHVGYNVASANEKDLRMFIKNKCSEGSNDF